MSKAVSRGQALQISARVATQINWDELDGDQIQNEVINLSPEEFGRRFTSFLKTGLTAGNSIKSFSAVRVCSEPESLLVPIGRTTIVPVTTEPFVAKDCFVLSTKDDASVKISYLGDNFKHWFLHKKEQPFVGWTLRYSKLSRSSVDNPIIAELGGKPKAETTLTEIFALMEEQKNGESGPLLNNGWRNIFYIKDVSGVLRAVSVRWYLGWRVNASQVTNPIVSDAGVRVFSRNS